MSTLLGKADSVVVATVLQSVMQNDELAVDLDILRTIKGNEQATGSVHLTYRSTSQLLARQSKKLQGKTGIWFLTQTASSWTVLPVVSGDIQLKDLYISVPTSNVDTTQSAPNSSSSDKLLKELNAAAVNPDTAEGVQTALQAADNGLGSDALISAFSELSLSPYTLAKVAGVSGMLRNSAPGAATALNAINVSALTPNEQIQLANGLCRYRSSDPGQVALLESMATGSDGTRLRSCAVHALREIHTVQTLSTLNGLLDDSDPQIRYDAVIGIAQFAMSPPIAQAEDKHVMLSNFKGNPTVTEELRKHFPIQSKFAADEQEYISYWKQWLRQPKAQ